MSYFVVLSFDLKDAQRSDYQTAYEDLAKLGFSKTITGDTGNPVVLPTTTCAGKFNGTSAASVGDDLVARIQTQFQARGFRSEIFVSVGGDWAWRHRTSGRK